MNKELKDLILSKIRKLKTKVFNKEREIERIKKEITKLEENL